MELDDYIEEVARLAHEMIDATGLDYIEAVEIAKESYYLIELALISQLIAIQNNSMTVYHSMK